MSACFHMTWPTCKQQLGSCFKVTCPCIAYQSVVSSIHRDERWSIVRNTLPHPLHTYYGKHVRSDFEISSQQNTRVQENLWLGGAVTLQPWSTAFISSAAFKAPPPSAGLLGRRGATSAFQESFGFDWQATRLLLILSLVKMLFPACAGSSWPCSEESEWSQCLANVLAAGCSPALRLGLHQEEAVFPFWAGCLISNCFKQ